MDSNEQIHPRVVPGLLSRNNPWAITRILPDLTIRRSDIFYTSSSDFRNRLIRRGTGFRGSDGVVGGSVVSGRVNEF